MTAEAEPTRKKILVIEDEPDIVRGLRDALEFEGFEVRAAATGGEGLESAKSDPPDCVLLDLSLPDASRLEAPMQLRAAAPEVPIVILSGLQDELLAIKAVQEGAQDYLVKGRVDGHTVGRSITYAVERKHAEMELSHKAMHDALTGLPNRTLFLDRLKHAVMRAKRHHSVMAVMFVDLNGFKPINDTYGHLAGDRILRDLGAVFLSRTRASDLIARYGGDEFLLLVVDLPLEDLAKASDRLIAEIESMHWQVSETSLTISATSGLAHSSLIPNATLEQLLDAADRDLYAKKWVKKHPDDASLYEYPGRSTGGSLIDIPVRVTPPRTRASET